MLTTGPQAVNVFATLLPGAAGGAFIRDTGADLRRFGGRASQGQCSHFLHLSLHAFIRVLLHDPAIPATTMATNAINGRYLVALNERLYFTKYDSALGYELWMFDPAVPTTTLVADIKPGSLSSNPGYLSVLDGKLYFRAQNNDGTELWMHDPAVPTTEEFLGNITAAPQVAGHRSVLEPFLTAADEVKFARATPETSTIQHTFETARDFILQTSGTEGGGA